MLIDSHCHLDFFDADEVPGLVERAATAGVAEMVTIGTRLVEADKQIALAERYPAVWCTVGVHPHNAAEHPVPDLAEIVALTRHPKVVGIGESGLDYFYDTAPRDVQQASFRVHIAAARATGLPLVIHARSADADMAGILREEHETGEFPFLLHCFSSGRELAEIATELGGYISLSGILTFPKSLEIRDIARDVPAERLLVETDAPYLAPVPFRGRRNEPAFVANTAAALAQVRGLGSGDLARLTTANFRRLFSKAAAA
jgi:TatD DNase family protein